MENFLLTTMNFIVYLLGAAIFGVNLSFGAAKSNKFMLHSYRAAVCGVAVGSIAHYVIKLFILGMFLDWYLFS